jgi:hypothetical protein
LTGTLPSGNLKYMSRFIFAALTIAGFSSAAAAQQIPGRDLLEFPVGLLAEAPPLSTSMVASIWNPASSVLPANVRGAIGFAGLTTPQEQGVQLEMAAGAYRLRPNLVSTFSYTQASVSDILRTETDPQSLASDIPYSTSLVSVGLASTIDKLALGVAARYRGAAFDADAFSIDAGATLDRVAGTAVRVSASTFLFSPARSKEAATYSFAADAPVLTRDSTFSLRGGYSLAHTEGRGRDDYVFGTTSYRQFNASAGVTQTTAYGASTRRVRLGLGVRYAEYLVAFGREEGAGGFGASYQFLLTRVFR